jgi:cellulose synthase/poly-beta-1,6-N-acetylglucosamine synthase-like glycosyltransferase
MVFSTFFVVFTIATMLPAALGLPEAVWTIYKGRRDSRERRRARAVEAGGAAVEGPPYHAFVIPNFKERPETLRATLNALSAHPSAKTKYIVVLAMEAREKGAGAKARALEEDYSDSFLHICHSLHKAGVPGECAGKASNASAAGRHLLCEVTETLASRGVRIEEVLVTVMDADTLIYEDYIDALEQAVGGSEGNMGWHRTLFIPYMRFSNTEDDPTVPDITRM